MPKQWKLVENCHRRNLNHVFTPSGYVCVMGYGHALILNRKRKSHEEKRKVLRWCNKNPWAHKARENYTHIREKLPWIAKKSPKRNNNKKRNIRSVYVHVSTHSPFEKRSPQKNVRNYKSFVGKLQYVRCMYIL